MENFQNIIQRLTVQSFAIKGFSFTFVGLIGNIIKDVSNIFLLIIGLLSIIVFWYLDSYYLHKERLYRQVEKSYDKDKGLDYTKYKITENRLKVFFSKTIWTIYVVQICFIVVLSLTAMEVL